MPAQLQLQLPPPARPPDPWAVALAYLPLVRRVAREFRRGEFDTDDLVQEGLIAVYRAVAKDDPARDRFGGLARVVAYRRMCDWLRWRHQDDRAIGDTSHARARADRVDVADLDDVLVAIESLTDRQRSVIDGHFGLNGPARSEARIGDEMGTTRMAVARLKFRGLARVRERLGVVT
jgi:RNA polymerase sigma factor (sigma-70 family)